MNFPQTLRRVTAALDQAGVAYMLTGSFAGAYYGAARSTQDIDLVIAASSRQLQVFIQNLPASEYYADLEAALEALKQTSMFNVIDLTTGWKIDLIIRKNREFSKEEFDRRRCVNIKGSSMFVATAEDIVIAKLEWSKLAQSQRQIEDVSAILRVHRVSLDQGYLERWISDLKLENQWEDAKRAAGA